MGGVGKPPRRPAVAPDVTLRLIVYTLRLAGVLAVAALAALPMSAQRNVLGEPLQVCSVDPMTGFFRNGSCDTGDMDRGTHVVCARVTEAFLAYSRSRGNDLITPRPEYQFPGLKAGDQWCLCALRWKEALLAGVAPPVALASTHERALEFVTLEQLRSHAIPADAAAATDPSEN